jgi:hypothetical protein
MVAISMTKIEVHRTKVRAGSHLVDLLWYGKVSASNRRVGSVPLGYGYVSMLLLLKGIEENPKALFEATCLIIACSLGYQTLDGALVTSKVISPTSTLNACGMGLKYHATYSTVQG